MGIKSECSIFLEGDRAPYAAVKWRQLCPSAVTGLIGLGQAGDGIAAKPMTASANTAEAVPSPSGMGIFSVAAS